jgi:tetratricopeptide (TPR) repeat protein
LLPHPVYPTTHGHGELSCALGLVLRYVSNRTDYLTPLAWSTVERSAGVAQSLASSSLGRTTLFYAGKTSVWATVRSKNMFSVCVICLKRRIALAAFLFLRRHARTNLPQDAMSAYDMTLRLPADSEALRSQAQHHFMNCLLRLLHRAFYRLCTVGYHTNVSFLQRATQVARRSVEHCPLKDDHRIMFLATRSTVLQIWSMHTADAESMCLSIVLSQRRLHVTPIDQVDFPTARSFAQHFWEMGISRAGPRAYIMDTVIAFLRDILQRCPPGHPLAQGLGDDLADMLKSRRALPCDSSLYDEMMAINMQSLLGQISTEPAMIDSHMSLSLAVLDRFHETRNYDRLSDARRLWEIALQRCPWDHPSRPALCYSAGSACLALHEHSGEYSLLGQAIQLHRQALACTPADGPDRETICRSLSVLLQKSFVRSGEIADLHGRVEMCRELLRLCSDRPSDRSDACDRLASALMRVFQHSGTVSALDEAKDLYEEALSLTPSGHPSRMRSCNNLAGALYEKHKQEAALDLLQRALILQKEHLRLSSAPEADPLARAGALCSLATTMAALDDVSGGHASEEECIALYLEALALLPENSHRPRSIACDGLLTQVQGRFRRTGDLPLLDIAIRYGRDVVTVSSPRQPNYRTICNSLAQALLMRYNFLAQTADLNESISLQRMLFSVMMPNHPRRIAACYTLASSLRLEFERTGDMDRLQEALSLLQQAYLMCPEDSTQHASVCAGYATLLWVLANVTMNVAWLEKAIDLFRDSLRLDVQGQAEQSEYLNSLGAFLATRYGVIGDLPSLEEAIQLFRKALELRPPGHVRRADTCFNLGANLLEYVIRVEDLSYMEETICFLKEAGDGGGSRRETADALSYVYLARAYLVPGTPFFDPPSAVMAVRQATEHGLKPTSIVYLTKQLDSLDLSLIPESHMGDMLRAFANVVECLPRLSNATMSFHTRLRTLKSGKNIGAASLRCAILAGDLKTGVELLDNSRAVFWSQALNMRDPQLENLPGGLRTELEHLLGALSSTPALVDGSPLTARDMIHQQNERLQRLIAEVRELPGLSRFMLGTPYEQLVSSFAGTAVVMFSADTGGCRVIVMGGATSRLVHLELEDISIDELEDRTSLLADLGMRLGNNETSLGDDERALGISKRLDGGSQMERLLSKLWLKAMKPVLYAMDYQTVCMPWRRAKTCS